MAGKRYLPYLIAVLATIGIVAVPSTSRRPQATKQVAAQAPTATQEQAALAPGDVTATTAVTGAGTQVPSAAGQSVPSNNTRAAAGTATTTPPKGGATA